RLDQYASESFNPSIVNRMIHRFYEETTTFNMFAQTTWSFGFRTFSQLFNRVTGRIGQLHIEPYRGTTAQQKQQKMCQTLFPIKQSEDGRQSPRAWIRHDEHTKETIFVAIYSEYVHRGERYMNIALPLPWSVMTGILRAENDSNDGLILTSVRREGSGHAGIYLTIGK